MTIFKIKIYLFNFNDVLDTFSCGEGEGGALRDHLLKQKTMGEKEQISKVGAHARPPPPSPRFVLPWTIISVRDTWWRELPQWLSDRPLPPPSPLFVLPWTVISVRDTWWRELPQWLSDRPPPPSPRLLLPWTVISVRDTWWRESASVAVW